MRNSSFAAPLCLLLILLPILVASQDTSDRIENLELGYVEVEDTVWQMARGNPPHPQRGLLSVYIPKHSKSLEPHRKDRRVRYALAAGRYQAVAYSSRGKFNVVITFRDHSPYHSGVISNTYYLELFSFEVEPEMVTSIRGYVRSYRSGNLSEKDRRNSGGYSAYWEPRIEAVTKRALTKTGSTRNTGKKCG